MTKEQLDRFGETIILTKEELDGIATELSRCGSPDERHDWALNYIYDRLGAKYGTYPDFPIHRKDPPYVYKESCYKWSRDDD